MQKNIHVKVSVLNVKHFVKKNKDMQGITLTLAIEIKIEIYICKLKKKKKL